MQSYEVRKIYISYNMYNKYNYYTNEYYMLFNIIDWEYYIKKNELEFKTDIEAFLNYLDNYKDFFF